MAAGLGFKTFAVGEVLSAANVNGYLMQGVLVFANATARDAAITSPQEGQFAFTKDNDSLWYYSGSAWVSSGATGDIEGVTAGTGISGGGTSGTVTITNSMATAIDAKGDLIGGTGADTFARLAVGANDTVLTADSSTATGLKWAAAAGGGSYTSLASGSLSGTSTSVNITTTGYKQVVAFVKNVTCTTDFYMGFDLNGDSGSNYSFISQYSSSSSAVSATNRSATSYFFVEVPFNLSNNTFATYVIDDPANTTAHKIVTATAAGRDSADTYNLNAQIFGRYMSNSAITNITFQPSSTYSTGTYEIYGVK